MSLESPINLLTEIDVVRNTLELHPAVLRIFEAVKKYHVVQSKTVGGKSCLHPQCSFKMHNRCKICPLCGGNGPSPVLISTSECIICHEPPPGESIRLACGCLYCKACLERRRAHQHKRCVKEGHHSGVFPRV